ncbi:MAG: U32 family peptidase, partial [Clostridia bacterium]|nr:U32 family peptidase [Clostridia bacterium]
MSDFLAHPLPELLCPAGSPEALDAAIEGGADAVYLGGTAFNARMNAHNFGGDALRSAVLRAHSYGVKVYLTLNTLVTDRELPAFVEAARDAASIGVDALIVADLGGAAAIHRAIPSLELHASTQMSGHNASAALELEKLGFSRMVIARETPARDLFETVKRSPLEIEMFIHGALCVSHSGQCLFSSLVGGRSGNRGECA